MIKVESRRVLQHRKGEEKTKPAGKLMHNPDVKNGRHEPFFYCGGACLNADELETIVHHLDVMAKEYKAKSS